MPKRDRSGGLPSTSAERHALSQEELDAINAKRHPSMQARANFCPATRRKPPHEGEPCDRQAGAGTTHRGIGYCSTHGGNTSAGKKHAARAYGRQLLLDQKERFGGDRNAPEILNITAEQALLEEVRRSVAMVRWLEQRIGDWQQVGDDPLPDGERGTGLPPLGTEDSSGHAAPTDIQAWLVLYREERAHSAKVAKMAIDANISERLVQIAEGQGHTLARVVQAVLEALNLTPDQAALVPQVVPGIITRVVDQNRPARSESSPTALELAPATTRPRTPYAPNR